MEDITERGQAIYQALQAQLEPTLTNQFVVIHVDSGDYAVGRTFSGAKRVLRQRHPADGRLFGRRIGTEPEYGLASRLLGSQMTAGKTP